MLEREREQYDVGIVARKEGVKSRLKAQAEDWAKDIVEGVLTALGMALLGLLLIQLGLARDGTELSFELFQPYEFWKSFKGLVVEWSQWNEWLLLALAIFCSLITLTLLWFTRKNGTIGEEEPESRTFFAPFTSLLGGTRTLGTTAMLAMLLFGAYGYQQYLWKVALPVPQEQIGIAFSRQVGSAIAQEQLADFLRQMGHEGQIVMRELPVTLDARNTEEARALARRIGADAVVIYRREGGEEAEVLSQARTGGGFAAPLRQALPSSTNSIAYIVFTDPVIGVEIPVPVRSSDGKVEGVSYRAKDGVEVPRLEAANVGHLMEATAGILLYDRDRYLASAAHLRNALEGGGGTPATNSLLYFYLGNVYELLDRSEQASDAFAKSVALLEEQATLGVQERLVLVKAYTSLADYYFYERDLDRAEELLRKAVALREPLDADQSALSDPTTARRVHDTFGTLYISLMQLVEYQGDEETAAYWADRAREEADQLLSLDDDRYARTNGIWMLYRTGACEDAYSRASSMLQEDADNIDARRLLWRIASTRDGWASSLERDLHIDAILERNPESLPELSMQLTTYALRTALEDSANLANVQATGDRILEIDPNNVYALEEVVSDIVFYTGADLVSDAATSIMPVGEPRTYDMLRLARSGEPQQLNELLDSYDMAKPYLLRWAEEVQPESAKPLVYKATLAHHKEQWLYWYLFLPEQLGVDPAAVVDPELEAAYLPIWESAVADANQVLEGNREATLEEKVTAHVLLVDLWSHRFYTTYESDAEAAAEAAARTLEHGQAAVDLAEGVTATTKDDLDIQAGAYMANLYAAATAKGHASQLGDEAKVAEYDALFNEALTRWQEATNAYLVQQQDDEAYLNRMSCTGAELPAEAEESAHEGEPTRSVDMMEEYVGYYPQDPRGLLSLGWYQYLNGQWEQSIATTQGFEHLEPDHPFGPGNRTLALLVLGQNAEARDAFSLMVEKLRAVEPVGVQLNQATAIGADFLTLARDNAGARGAIGELLPQIEAYFNALPPEAWQERGSLLIVALNNFGSAALWAGDYALAERLYHDGLEINPDWVLLRTNLGLARIGAGDMVGAREAYDAAIASAETYLKDPSRVELEGEARDVGAAAAAQELDAAIDVLERLLEEQPSMRGEGEPLLALLRDASTRYKE